MATVSLCSDLCSFRGRIADDVELQATVSQVLNGIFPPKLGNVVDLIILGEVIDLTLPVRTRPVNQDVLLKPQARPTNARGDNTNVLCEFLCPP